MATDRFVYWRKEKPSRAELRAIVEDYLGEAAEEISEEGPRIIVKLCGAPTSPLARVKGVPKCLVYISKDHTERWFEVYVAKDSVDVITRMGDEYTSVVANGLVKILARWYEARVEQD